MPLPDPGLVLHLPMSEGAGTTVYDASRYGNDGALNGCKWVEHGLEFNGSSDYVNAILMDVVSKNNIHSVSMWINATADDTVNGRIIFANTNGAANRVGILFRDGEVRAGIYDGVGYSNVCSGEISLNEWYNICYTYDTSSLKLYINGILQTGTSIPYLVSGTNFSIGSAIDHGQRFFTGSIDDVRIHNRALSAAEIKRQYNQEVHHYK